MKIAPLIKRMKEEKSLQPLLLHTGQHYDPSMSENFFRELMIPEPDIYLGVGSDSHAKQVARIMSKFEDVCLQEKPDAILVVGDVNSTMACSLVASKMGIKIVHLEAGLRSFDRTMPEEINRVVTDALADLLLTPSEDADRNLRNEGIAEHKIRRVGNIMIDTLYYFLPLADQRPILQKHRLVAKNYVLVTLHRPSNVDDPVKLRNILDALSKISAWLPVIFPVHPRTMKNLQGFGILKDFPRTDHVIFEEALGYLDFQKLMKDSRLVVTDSGGIQEETTVLGIPCITLRENTERPVTVELGTNELAGHDLNLLLSLARNAIEGNWKKGTIPPLWDGKTSDRSVRAIQEIFNEA
jgi:UDP-N-acetylglucosamine 2-epimerase (non-hydrolysing)